MIKHNRQQNGDTIVEVLIALIIISAVLVGAYLSARSSLTNTYRSQERSEALKQAESQLEQLKANTDKAAGAGTEFFCLNGDDIVTFDGGSPAASAAEDNFDNYPVNCKTTGEVPYHFSVKQTDGVYVLLVRWDRAGGGGREEVKIIYGTGSASDMVPPPGGGDPPDDPAPADTTPPTVPTGVTASAVSTNQINVSWIASTDAVGPVSYVIQGCTGNNCSNFTDIGNSTTDSFQHSGLTASTIYRYRVRAVDGANNNSPYSNIDSDTTQNLLPDINLSYSCTGSSTTYTVPAGYGHITVDVRGGSGGNNSSSSSNGGFGGRVEVTGTGITVTPGSVLTIYVGCSGRNGVSTGAIGGFGGGVGGAGGRATTTYGGFGGSGGGSSEIRAGNTKLVVAGGGGGGGGIVACGGSRGGWNNTSGFWNPAGAIGSCGIGGIGGGPGTLSAGGSGGSNGGSAGSGSNGGAGGGTNNTVSGGGGGGGGYFGGGGGGSHNSYDGGGGGAGSSYASISSGVVISNLTALGNGSVTITVKP